MVPLINIERGMVIADRYVVSEELRPWLAEFPEAGRVCLVIDAILDEPALLFAADSAQSGDLLDAARRTALLTDPRIPALHDVGRFEDIDYVVSERVEATGLPQLLATGPLDPEAARALVGEAATAFVHASKRGLHHLCLGPESLALNTRGEVVVHGMAIDAAVADAPYRLGLDALSGQDALHEDALALVNVLYVALTAHWPGPEPRAGLPVAPKKNALFARASAITPGIPRELEEFVSGVITRAEAGPRSPSEIVRYLGEWDTRALARLTRGAPEPGDDLFPGGTAGFTGRSDDSERRAGETGHDRSGVPGGSGAGAAAGNAAAAAAVDTGISGGPARPEIPARPSAPPREIRVRPSAPPSEVGVRPSAPPREVGVRPSRVPQPVPSEDLPPTQPTHRATPQQLQAALTRIGMHRPGTRGLAAGVPGAGPAPFDERMQMRLATTFPVAAESLDRAAQEAREWQPEDTFSSYSEYASREHDADLTMPILTRGQLWDYSEDTNAFEPGQFEPGQPGPSRTEPDQTDRFSGTTAEQDRVEDGGDDAAWFLGGMFTTREEELSRQRADFDRERRLQQEAEASTRRGSTTPALDRNRPADNVRGSAASAPAAGIADGTSDSATPADAESAGGTPAGSESAGGAPGTESAGGAPIGGSSSEAPREAARRERAARNQARRSEASRIRTQPIDRTTAPQGTYPPGPDSSGQERRPTPPRPIVRRQAPDPRPERSRGASSAGRHSREPAGPGAGAAGAGVAGAAGTGTTNAGVAREVENPAGAASGTGSTAAGTSAAAADAAPAAAVTPTVAAGTSAPVAPTSDGGSPAGGGGSDGRRRRRRRGRGKALPLTIAGLVLLVVIGLIAAMILGPGSSPTAENPEQTTEPGEAASAPVIASAEALDPQGDGSENDADAENVLPGVSGSWETELYNTAAFGGLKDGLGLAFELEEPATVSRVDLISDTPGGEVEIRVGDTVDPEDAEVAASGALPTDEEPIDLAEPATGSYLFVWITELPPADGGFRVRISEVALS